MDCGPQVPLASNAYLANYEGILGNHPNCAGTNVNTCNVMLVSRYSRSAHRNFMQGRPKTLIRFAKLNYKNNKCNNV